MALRASLLLALLVASSAAAFLGCRGGLPPRIAAGGPALQKAYAECVGGLRAAAARRCAEGACDSKAADAIPTLCEETRPPVAWGRPLVLAVSRGGQLGPVLSEQIVDGEIGRDMHHVSLSVDSVFLRNLPGIPPGSDVLLGLSIDGAVRKTLSTLVEPFAASGPNAFVVKDNLMVAEPFVYAGRELTLTVSVGRLAAADVARVSGMVAGGRSVFRRLDPYRQGHISAARNIYVAAFAGPELSRGLWRFTQRFQPATTGDRSRPDSLLLAGRYLVSLLPDASAPAELKARVSARSLVTKARLRGNRLIWKETDEEFVDAPYLVLNVTRYARWPAPETELARAIAELDTAVGRAQIASARALLARARTLLTDAPRLTTPERSLTAAMLELREVKIAIAEAREKQDLAARRQQSEALVQRMGAILSQFCAPRACILEPYERKDLEQQMQRIRRELR